MYGYGKSGGNLWNSEAKIFVHFLLDLELLLQVNTLYLTSLQKIFYCGIKYAVVTHLKAKHVTDISILDPL